MAQSESSKPNRQAVIAAAIFAVVLAGAAWKAWDATHQMEQLTQAAAPLVATPPGPPPPPAPSLAAAEPPAGQPLVLGQLLLTRAQPVAPPLSLPTVDGGRFDLAALKGQVVFVNFWATWCPPCGKEMPGMVKLGQELTARHPGKFKMVAVSVDESADLVKQFFKSPTQGGRLPASVAVAIDSEARLVRPWYCKGRGACAPDDVKFPESYIVDKSGRIAAYVIGDMDWSEPAAKELLERLING
jgi:thiol-disulfide isomerase/thioredoxin